MPHIAFMATTTATRTPRNPYIVVGHYADGARVTDVGSKAEAHRVGQALRRAGVEAFAYSVTDAAKFGLDPRQA